jgi:D-alanyl-D-alanine carboxypeptidase/D-alanyl-D-alanine-endopeptidase (penicillin-binding protein 4)
MVISAALLLVGMASGAVAQNLTKRLDARLDRPPFNRQIWGVALLDEKGKLLYGRNADRMFMPASNTKIIVSAVAAALLPPDGTVRTSLYAAGPVVDGVLRGDLVLYGRGDPTMGRRCYAVDTTAAGACDTDPFARLRVLADTLRARGIRTVAGDVVGDGSYFDAVLVHPEWESYDLNWWYAAPAAASASTTTAWTSRMHPARRKAPRSGFRWSPTSAISSWRIARGPARPAAGRRLIFSA